MFQEWRLFSDMQQTVRLLNDLGERYGSEHEYFDLRSPAEAIKLLCINKPEFAKELAEAHKHGIGYTLVQADGFLDYDDLHLPLGRNDLILAPVVAGSGGKVGKVLLGVGLIAASIFIPGAMAIGFGLQFGAISLSVGVIGGGLLLSGIADIISPQPVIPDLTNRSKPGQNTNATGPQGVSRATSGEQSYAFSGPANTVGVGATVPLVYGELIIGSHLISSDVHIVAESDPTGEYFSGTGASSVTVNGEKPKNKFTSLAGLRTRRWDNSDLKGESGDKRKKFNTSIYLNETGTTVIAGNDEIDNKDDDNEASENLQILFQVDRGLYNIIGSQKVPAFVTYEITIVKNNYSGKSPTFANVRGTLAGLLKESQVYQHCHAISYGASGEEDGDTTIELRIRIMDTDADSSNRIVVKGLGYNWFQKESENRTEDLAEV